MRERWVRWWRERLPRRGRLEPRVPAFLELFPPGERPRRIASGFRFTEGPVWLARADVLLFSDIPADRIYRMKPGGKVEVYREPSGHSNGLTLDADGRLIACEHGNRRVSRTDPDGTVRTLADRFRGQRLNSPNDVVVKSDGTIYFTDPPYGLEPNQRELSVQGVYRILPDSGRLDLVCDDFLRPNGLAFSPDETRLYIDDSADERRHIRVFELSPDGTLGADRVFHDMNVEQPGAPDGMKVDVDGRLYCTGAGGVWVFDPAGVHLGTIALPEKPANCAWGDSDGRSLYITARTSVYRIRLSGRGMPPG